MMVSWKLPGNLERPTPLMPASRQHLYDDGKCALTLHFRQSVIEEIQKLRPDRLDLAFETFQGLTMKSFFWGAMVTL